MSEPLLSIRNHHVASCGDPPIINGDSGNCYLGYFENPFGEQWIFTMDWDTGKVVLRGGDVGWNNSYEVLDGRVADLILGNEERLWLQACWLSVAKLKRCM